MHRFKVVPRWTWKSMLSITGLSRFTSAMVSRLYLAAGG
jgi:hypothetical protein